jgi:hypothetical protein
MVRENWQVIVKIVRQVKYSNTESVNSHTKPIHAGKIAENVKGTDRLD